MTALVKDGAEQRSPKHFRFITYVGMMGATLRSWVLCRSGGSSSGPVDVTTDVNVAGSSHPHSGTQGGGKSSSGPVNVDASVNVAGSSHPHSGTQGGGWILQRPCQRRRQCERARLRGRQCERGRLITPPLRQEAPLLGIFYAPSTHTSGGCLFLISYSLLLEVQSEEHFKVP